MVALYKTRFFLIGQFWQRLPKFIDLTRLPAERWNIGFRYFPEPDIPPFRWQSGEIDEFRKALPELPDEKKARFIQSYHITEYDAERLTRERRLADFFEGAVKVGQEHGLDPKTIANVVMNKKIDIDTTVPAELIKNIVASRRIDATDETELQSIIQE